MAWNRAAVQGHVRDPGVVLAFEGMREATPAWCGQPLGGTTATFCHGVAGTLERFYCERLRVATSPQSRSPIRVNGRRRVKNPRPLQDSAGEGQEFNRIRVCQSTSRNHFAAGAAGAGCGFRASTAFFASAATADAASATCFTAGSLSSAGLTVAARSVAFFAAAAAAV